MRDPGHGCVMIIDIHDQLTGSAGANGSPDAFHGFSCRPPVGCHDPSPVNEQLAMCRHRPGVVGASHRMGTDIAAQIDITLPESVENPRLDRTDVCDGRIRIDLETVHHQVGNGAGWHRDDNKINICRDRRLDRAGAQTGGDPGVADLVITQMNRVAGGGEVASD
jgi:hypothetical protein